MPWHVRGRATLRCSAHRLWSLIDRCGLLPDKKLENECRAAALPPRAATCSGLFLQSTVTYIPYLYNANLTPTNMATSTDRIGCRLPNLADSISRLATLERHLGLAAHGPWAAHSAIVTGRGLAPRHGAPRHSHCDTTHWSLDTAVQTPLGLAALLAHSPSDACRNIAILALTRSFRPVYTRLLAIILASSFASSAPLPS